MSRPSDNPAGQTRRIAFYATPPHSCAYLPGQRAVTLFADPNAPLDNHIYSHLALYGYRRSGPHIYRPSCPDCAACIPVRVPVDAFRPRRSQRRTWRRNQDLQVRILPPEFDDEHFRLYSKYIQDRHPDGGMDVAEPAQYMQFLTSTWSDTRFAEFRAAGALVAVAVYDHLESGLSAVYTFFDPDYAARGLGTHAVLWEIEQARREGLPWLYLGYWIEHCTKMSYKRRFQPLEQFREGRWRRLPPGE